MYPPDIPGQAAKHAALILIQDFIIEDSALPFFNIVMLASFCTFTKVWKMKMGFRTRTRSFRKVGGVVVVNCF